MFATSTKVTINTHAAAIPMFRYNSSWITWLNKTHDKNKSENKTTEPVSNKVLVNSKKLQVVPCCYDYVAIYVEKYLNWYSFVKHICCNCYLIVVFLLKYKDSKIFYKPIKTLFSDKKNWFSTLVLFEMII